MAANDVSITAASVLKGSGATTVLGTAGASITAGQALYIDTANGSVLKLADGNGTTLTATFAGFALHAALTGQPVDYLSAGPITIGGTLVAGKFYILSDTAGAITLVSDYTTGFIPCLVGWASSTTVLQVVPIATGVTL